MRTTGTTIVAIKTCPHTKLSSYSFLPDGTADGFTFCLRHEVPCNCMIAGSCLNSLSRDEIAFFKRYIDAGKIDCIDLSDVKAIKRFVVRPFALDDMPTRGGAA